MRGNTLPVVAALALLASAASATAQPPQRMWAGVRLGVSTSRFGGDDEEVGLSESRTAFSATGVFGLQVTRRWRSSPSWPCRRFGLLTPAQDPRGADQRRGSSLVERVTAGWLGGAAVFLAARSLGADDDVSTLAFSTGSFAGLMLSTAGREGARPLEVLFGTALGGLALLAAVDASSDAEATALDFLVIVLPASFLPPLGGALAHSL